MKGYDEFKSVAIGCDHAAFELKQAIKEYFTKKGFEVFDAVPVFMNPIPYVDTAGKVCRKVLENKGTLGILACGTGIGMSIAANRHKEISAAILYDDFTAEFSRRHTNANVIVFGARTMKNEDVERRIEIFLSNEFEGGKYAERNRLLDEPDI
ncbi:MAG: RpiB/LacA/LacB family sugar-phosphate isomerase [Clostridia bacterium]|jgi:ribose 5-phosphate isomerase B